MGDEWRREWGLEMARESNWSQDGVVDRMHGDDRGLKRMHKAARAAGSLSVG